MTNTAKNNLRRLNNEVTSVLLSQDSYQIEMFRLDLVHSALSPCDDANKVMFAMIELMAAQLWKEHSDSECEIFENQIETLLA